MLQINTPVKSLIWIYSLSLLILFDSGCWGQESQPFRKGPTSHVNESSNGRFVFVRLSAVDLDRYRHEAIKGWRKAGLSGEKLRNLLLGLEAEIRKENGLRRRYSVDGVYEAKSDKLVFQTKAHLFSQSVLVSDGGNYVVGINNFVTDFTLKAGMKITKTYIDSVSQDIISVIFRDGRPNCGTKFSEIVSETDRFNLTSEGILWMEDVASLDEITNRVLITKLNGSVVVFDVANCTILSPKNPAATETTESGCLGLLGLFVSTFLLLIR